MGDTTTHILVTGASTGIGHATVAELLEHGCTVFGSVRNAEDAERLSTEFGQDFTPLLFDVRQEDEIQAAVTHVTDKLGAQGLDGLVNNAGISIPGPLSVISASVLREHLEINVIGVFNVTQAFLPLLGTQEPRTQAPGRIVNMSSTSGRIAFPFMGPYAASKHALEALSDSWRRELMPYGIDVIVIEPGAIETPIWDKAAGISSMYADSDYADVLARIDLTETKRRALPVQKVARTVRHALQCRRPKTRYAIPDKRFTYWLAPRMLPDRWVDRVIQRTLGLRKKKK